MVKSSTEIHGKVATILRQPHVGASETADEILLEFDR